tara:strand:- start:4533 stop:5063 length:531 start_codon:yes stop_codon:yes gene_type:complete
MAAGNTKDTRVHVLGDLYMLTGTFTDGGLDVYYGDHISTVLAAGANSTELYATNVTKDGALSAGATGTFTVATVDMRLHFNVGDTIYDSAGDRVGVVSAMAADATGMEVTKVLKDIGNTDVLYKKGVAKPAVTLMNTGLDVGIDTKNKYIVIDGGNLGAASRSHTIDGTWWILGQR